MSIHTLNFYLLKKIRVKNYYFYFRAAKTFQWHIRAVSLQDIKLENKILDNLNILYSNFENTTLIIQH